jgi:putative phosphoesterase
MITAIVLSDTHGNHFFLRKALQFCPSAEYILHLGDQYEDLDDHIDLISDKTVIKVPGINHPLYFHPKFDSVKSFVIANWTIGMAHDKRDFIKKRINADLYLFGHTHHPVFLEQNGHFYLNPGHLKSPEDRGNPATFAVLEISEEKIDGKIYYLSGNIFLEKTLHK